jgi:hypothetical protein
MGSKIGIVDRVGVFRRREFSVHVAVGTKTAVGMAAGVDFAEFLDVDMGIDLGGLMAATAATPTGHVASLLSISLRSVPCVRGLTFPGRSGCRHRRGACRWHTNAARGGRSRVCRCRSV